MNKNLLNTTILSSDEIVDTISQSPESFLNEFGFDYYKIYMSEFNSWLNLCRNTQKSPGKLIQKHFSGDKLSVSYHLEEVFFMIKIFFDNPKDIENSKNKIQNDIKKRATEILRGHKYGLLKYIKSGIHTENVIPEDVSKNMKLFLETYGLQKTLDLSIKRSNQEIYIEINKIIFDMILSGVISQESKMRYIESIMIGIGYIFDSELDGIDENGIVKAFFEDYTLEN